MNRSLRHSRHSATRKQTSKIIDRIGSADFDRQPASKQPTQRNEFVYSLYY